MNLHVQLPQFEGPLGLLLYLIKKEEMNILDIDIHVICKQYLSTLQLMRELDLEVAGEFVSMASTLIHIKSRMILPQYNEQGEIVENEDPRKELVKRLVEYQKFQEASKNLYERPLLGRDIFPRGEKFNLEPSTTEVTLDEKGLFHLISAYRFILRSLKKKIHFVATKSQSIAGRILEIRNKFILGQRISFKDLFLPGEGVSQKVLITFLSLLELSKLGFVSLFQPDMTSEIYIETKKIIEGDVISQVDEFEASSKNIELLMEEAQAEQDHEMREDVAMISIESQEGVNSELDSSISPATDEEIFEAEMSLTLNEEEINEKILLNSENQTGESS